MPHSKKMNIHDGKKRVMEASKSPYIPDDVYAWLMKIIKPAPPTLTDSLAFYGAETMKSIIRDKVNHAKNLHAGEVRYE